MPTAPPNPDDRRLDAYLARGRALSAAEWGRLDAIGVLEYGLMAVAYRALDVEVADRLYATVEPVIPSPPSTARSPDSPPRRRSRASGGRPHPRP